VGSIVYLYVCVFVYLYVWVCLPVRVGLSTCEYVGSRLYLSVSLAVEDVGSVFVVRRPIRCFRSRPTTLTHLTAAPSMSNVTRQTARAPGPCAPTTIYNTTRVTATTTSITSTTYTTRPTTFLDQTLTSSMTSALRHFRCASSIPRPETSVSTNVG